MHLRHYLIESSWARKRPRYRPAYERVRLREGSKVGRLVVARMLLRSIDKVLKEGIAFDPGRTPVEAIAALRVPGALLPTGRAGPARTTELR